MSCYLAKSLSVSVLKKDACVRRFPAFHLAGTATRTNPIKLAADDNRHIPPIYLYLESVNAATSDRSGKTPLELR